jgi:hypothetical protein
MGASGRASELGRETKRTDRRWLIHTAIVFTLSVVLLAATYGVYRATGPHPHVRALVRQVMHFAHWLLPDVQPRH